MNTYISCNKNQINEGADPDDSKREREGATLRSATVEIRN